MTTPPATTTCPDRLEGNDDLRRWLKSRSPNRGKYSTPMTNTSDGEVVCPRCGSDHTEAVINTDCEDVRGRCSLIFVARAGRLTFGAER